MSRTSSSTPTPSFGLDPPVIDRVTASFSKVVDTPEYSAFVFPGPIVLKFAHHSVFGKFEDADPLGSDVLDLFKGRGAEIAESLQNVAGLVEEDVFSNRFFEAVLASAGFADEKGRLESPYPNLTKAEFLRLSHNLVSAAGHISDQRWLSRAQVGALFDIATATRTEADKGKVWRCNDYWMPYIFEEGIGYRIYSPASGLPEKERLIRDFYESAAAAYACEIDGHFTAVVVDHTFANFYFYDSMWADEKGQERLVLVWNLMRKYYLMNRHPKASDIFNGAPRAVVGLQQERDDTCGILAAEFVRTLIREGLTVPMSSRVHDEKCCSREGGAEACVREKWLGWCGSLIGVRFATESGPVFYQGSAEVLARYQEEDELERMYEEGINATMGGSDWDRKTYPVREEPGFPAVCPVAFVFNDQGVISQAASAYAAPVPEDSSGDEEGDDDPFEGFASPVPDPLPPRVAAAAAALATVRYLRDFKKDGTITDKQADRRRRLAEDREEFLAGFEDPYVTDAGRATETDGFSMPMAHTRNWEGWLRAYAGKVFDEAEDGGSETDEESGLGGQSDDDNDNGSDRTLRPTSRVRCSTVESDEDPASEDGAEAGPSRPMTRQRRAEEEEARAREEALEGERDSAVAKVARLEEELEAQAQLIQELMKKVRPDPK